MRRAIIFAIGNELLIGETLDSNTHWLCRQLTGLGGHIERGAMLPDLIEVIAAEVRRACQAGIDLLITTGGLGPTDDDLTFSAIAQALELPLACNEQAYQWIAAKYQQLVADGYVTSAEMNPARVKMAMLPVGGIPIFNPIGSAPALQITHQATTIISLPGVPIEMKAIVEKSLAPFLSSLFGAGAFIERELWINCGDESLLAPLLREVVTAHPHVYIKSKAKGFGHNQNFHVILHARGDAIALASLLAEAESALQQVIARAGFAMVGKPNS